MTAGVAARVLIIGGYGVFGARVAERLLRASDIEVTIAGRRADAAQSAAVALGRQFGRKVGHAALDATRSDAAAIAATGAGIVINASGPFQAQDYTLAKAAIAAGVHYIDLADPRDFVTGITALDVAARAAGVLVVSGASSVPGLSSAVLAAHAASFARLTSVRHGISPGNSFDPGEATTASIVGAVGQPFSMRLAGREKTVYGWQGLHRHRFPGIGKRWMGHCDVPDLSLFPARHPLLETARFSAGVEVALFHLGLWVLSGLVRLGVVARPERLAAFMLAIKRHLGFLGTDTGGMFMTLDGHDAQGQPKRIDWHLEARSGHGPYIPAIASVILARKLARGELATRGAVPCMELFTLAEFMDEVADLDIRATDTSTPLYKRVLASTFTDLPPLVRQLHDVVDRPMTWSGRAEVVRGDSLLSRLAARLARLPPTARDVPLSVTFRPDRGREIWVRTFGSHVFRSVQGEAATRIWETVGPAWFEFEPEAKDGSLRLELRGLRVMGVPMPRMLWPHVRTREWEDGGRYCFAVEARLPTGALLIQYTGWLEPGRDQRKIPSADNGL